MIHKKFFLCCVAIILAALVLLVFDFIYSVTRMPPQNPGPFAIGMACLMFIDAVVILSAMIVFAWRSDEW